MTHTLFLNRLPHQRSSAWTSSVCGCLATTACGQDSPDSVGCILQRAPALRISSLACRDALRELKLWRKSSVNFQAPPVPVAGEVFPTAQRRQANGIHAIERLHIKNAASQTTPPRSAGSLVTCLLHTPSRQSVPRTAVLALSSSDHPHPPYYSFAPVSFSPPQPPSCHTRPS